MNSGRPGTLTVYRWEMLKLRAQKRSYLGLGIVTAVPLIFVISLSLRNGGPDDVAFGRYVHQSGLAIPLVILVFASAFLLPLATALVAGDIVAAEDHNGTLKTILTRSLDRGQVFAGKLLAAMTYALIALLLMGTVATVAGSLESGFNPLTSLSGTHVPALKALGLVYASFGVYFMPILAIVAIGVLLSTTTRNSAGAVVGTVMVVLMLNLVDIVPGLEFIRPYLLPHQFEAWMGFLREPIDWSPIIRAAWVSAVYAVPCAFAAYLVFLRRDVTGG
ncbi:MAG: type transport system permease protein [Solirubrobacteraceae bacterium]|jgi:ABC-2 type transport system permease protein|nr:type transport system permease protein [Solirubrobacteraceae bacterium]MEA2300093.1 type transport system permease protein [Solirubrobacteraceae bacterium]